MKYFEYKHNNFTLETLNQENFLKLSIKEDFYVKYDHHRRMFAFDVLS
jgi:hypothetical protein